MTIQERAKKFSDNYCVGDAAIIVDLVRKVAEEAYIAGATDQRDIDIDKLKIAMNALMIDTKDKAAIIKLMEEIILMGTLGKTIEKDIEKQPLCNLDPIVVFLLGMETQLELDTRKACEFVCKRCPDKDDRCDQNKCQYINDIVKALKR